MSPSQATQAPAGPELPATFRIRLTMLSDWHAGTGTGRPGNVNRLVVRDDDGLPFIPAKTLRGIWRNACERLARGLDEGRVGDWSRLVDTIFGSQPALGKDDPTRRHADPSASPIGASLRVTPARMDAAIRRSLRTDRRLLQAVTLIKPGVQIDCRTGQAKQGHLRFEEVARVNAVLEAGCSIELPADASRSAVSAMLLAATRLVERLGGKRRRGAGRCSLQIRESDGSAVNLSRAIAWLESNPSVPKPPEKRPSENDPVAKQDAIEPVDQPAAVAEAPASLESEATSTSTAQSPGEWVRVPLVLHLEGPLAVSYRTVGNVVETLDFLPGTYLLPHVSRVFEDLDLDVAGAAACGDLCVLPATLAIDGGRGRPVPLAFFEPKGVDGFKAPDCLVNRLEAGDDSDGQLKQVRAGYLGPGDSSNPPRLGKVPPFLRTHNTIQDGPQRPTADVGGVYSYKAIAPTDKEGQPVILRSELRLRKSLAEKLIARDPNWTAKLRGNLRLGRSRKDDYGAVRLEVEPPRTQTTPTGSPAPAGGELVVWLLSDTLIRDQQLRPATTAEALGTELGRKLEAILAPRKDTQTEQGGEPAHDVGKKKTADPRLHELIRVRRLDTWHAAWQRPRPSLVGLQAGSCVVYDISGTLDPAKLHDVEMSGVGERTAEGYGQVCFNHPLLRVVPKRWNSRASEPEEKMTKPSAPAPPRIVVGESGHSFASLIEREVWRAEIRRSALGLAADQVKREGLLRWSFQKDEPPMSQLGALRNVLGRLHKPGDEAQVKDWLKHLQKTKRREEKWPEDAISNTRNLLEDVNSVWTNLRCVDWPAVTQDAEVRLKAELWPLAVRTLFDACIRAHKRDLEHYHKSRAKGAAHGT